MIGRIRCSNLLEDQCGYDLLSIGPFLDLEHTNEHGAQGEEAQQIDEVDFRELDPLLSLLALC